MKILQNFSIFYEKLREKTKICQILKFPEISQMILSKFSENDIRKVGKNRKTYW